MGAAEGVRPGPTPFTLLCPPGWQRIPAEALLAEDATQAVFGAIRDAGRADIALQMRALLTQYRRAIRELRVFEIYLPPVADGVRLPAALMISPVVLPVGVDWDAALVRLSRGLPVEQADFTETPMWVWRREDWFGDEREVRVREATYFVPVHEDAPARRALRFQYTVLTPPTAEGDEAARQLLDIGDLVMSTMRWQQAAATAR
ncbi:hypothetical protein [Microbacterium terricola]|nr:hypothetical protein [Microbacterium terricola]UYK39555.1 hypothetical protein OAU46_12735 [Microbacterium terricola]